MNCERNCRIPSSLLRSSRLLTCSLLSLTTPAFCGAGFTAAVEMVGFAGFEDMVFGGDRPGRVGGSTFFFFLGLASPLALTRFFPLSVLLSSPSAEDEETGQSPRLGGEEFPELVSALRSVTKGSDPVPPSSPEPLLVELKVEPIGRSAGCEYEDCASVEFSPCCDGGKGERSDE